MMLLAEAASRAAARVTALDMGRGLRPPQGSFPWVSAASIAALLTATLFGVWLLIRYLKERDGDGYRCPRRLFNDLCRAHELDRASRKLLQRLAAAHHLAQPSLVFLDPDRFDTAQLDASWSQETTTLAELREQLFGPLAT